ncbi:MAG: 1-acyl-sn-glycerol-3-phosphate acyltransferase [Candidatus Bipolaricaulota bacterium]|nr:1-acyl-sn-glycerol-3-phosphate acyltransferase [Candidatus Bipolaricaulota bacterium]MCS7275104.1 1-acyl-sn-glycerol-3-phosphate acyltransferase [Candidatus Bipolaricaulota bacterium]MDW8110272.1 lysophospholipid acyltransferase family protein [Candidatus Bipolaricaulota bacterium]MDW8328827.1 lysophospholipid acyltransferase family protein [Candidatus Bipolaricaulota bacterium]
MNAEALKGFFYWLLAPVLGVIVRALFRLRVRGWENLPPQRGFLLVARHRSYWDIPLLITALGRHHRIYFVARRTLLQENPFLAFWVRHYAITIDREHFRPEDFRKVIQALQEQKIVGIFPEGTTRNPQRVHPGVVRFAERTQSEIVPVRLEARGPYPPKYPFRWPQITAHIGAPFSLRDLEFDLPDTIEDRHERYQKLADLLMERVDRTGIKPQDAHARLEVRP